MFAALGRWCFQRRWTVVVLWVVVVLIGAGALKAVGTQSRAQFELPNVESRRGTQILENQFGGQGAGDSGTIVFQADQGVADPRVRAAMEQLFARVDAMDVGSGDVAVASPYSQGHEHQISVRGDSAGKIAYADVELPANLSQQDAVALTKQIDRAMPHLQGLQVELGGSVFAQFEAPSSELLGLAFAIVILVAAFGSVLAMGLPVGVALAGIGVGTILAGLVSHIVTMPDFASTLGVMIGLGVGIDYALFIVTRFRENLRNGDDVETATVVAMDTAGRAVLFAGTTVVISLLGMVVMGMGFLTGLAVGAATVVGVTMVASLTLLPALLAFAKRRVEVTRWRGLIAAGLVALALVGVGLKISPLVLAGLPLAAVVLAASFAVAPLRRAVPRRARRPLRETFAYRWSRAIQHHPLRAAGIGALVLAVLAMPVFGLRMGFSDEGNYPKDTTTRQAYDMLAEGFSPGFNGPLVVTSEVPAGTGAAAAAHVTDALAAEPGVAFATPPVYNQDGTAVLWRVIPTSAPQDAATTDLVNHLRSDVLPATTDGTGLHPAVTGSVAVGIDFSNYLASRLPWFFGAVLGLSFLLLMVVFRSVLVPLKAVIMNLLSIGAAYGVVVAAFQWGWAGPLLGIASAPIEPFIPMMLFAIVFGLSMDYEVFLLSRVKEEWDRTGDSHASVANGLAATARVISAAALIMVFVFGSFLLESDRIIKLFGTGLATAVLLDATVVRMLLVPATMELLGDRNWWLPRWLARVLPRLSVEGPSEPSDDTGPSDGAEPPPETEPPRAPQPALEPA